MVGWAAVVWTIALAVAVAVVGLTDDCAEVAVSDLDICRLDRGSTISGIALVWFMGALPMAIVWVLARVRRPRCRICGDELGVGEARLCRRCGARLIETAAR